MKDLAPGTRAKLGASNDLWSTYNDGATVLTETARRVLTLDLEAGRFLVSAKGLIRGSGASPVAKCELNSGIAADLSHVSPAASRAYGSISTQIVFDTEVPRQVYLQCAGTNANLYWKKMTAVRVDSVTNTAYPNVG